MTKRNQEEAQHIKFMKEALKLAMRASDAGEVPIGAVVVVGGKVVGRGYNQSISRRDPTAHAEVQALRQAARSMGNYRLTSATVYCTLEPCVMCAGALIWARIHGLVYAARDPKAGAIESHLQLSQCAFSNHRYIVISGILENESAQLLSGFFKGKRQKQERVSL